MTTLVDLSQDITELKPGLVALRRELHQHPELAFEEVWTAATLAGRMRALGLTVQEGIGGTGWPRQIEGYRRPRTELLAILSSPPRSAGPVRVERRSA